jgi:hypothetical protein
MELSPIRRRVVLAVRLDLCPFATRAQRLFTTTANDLWMFASPQWRLCS